MPFWLAGLLVGAACGAPDEVKRVIVQTGGQTAGSSGGAGTGGVTSSGSPGTGGAVGGASSAAPASSAGGMAGGITTGGGAGAGSSTSSKGGSSGGSTASTAKSSSRGGAGGTTTYPPVGGTSGGTTTSGGSTGSTGGTGGSEPPPPNDSLAAYLTQKTTGSSGQLGVALYIANTTSKPIDLSTVTLRYWYQDQGEGIGASAKFEVDDARVGDSNSVKDKVSGAVVAAPSPTAGADHYLEISFSSATLAAKGSTGNTDRLTLGGRLHNDGYKGTVDATNDYSYGDVGYDKKITFHDKTGKVIAGTPPGGGTGPTPSPDAGSPDVAPIDGNRIH